MLSNEIEKKLNEQVNAEFDAAYLYLSMSAWLDKQGLSGFANWFKMQAQEETTHAMKIYDYISERGGEISLLPIGKPKDNWKGCLDVVEDAYNHEKKVTAMINDIVALAELNKDYATRVFFDWYVTEQVEEESSSLDLVDKVKFVGEHKGYLLSLDKELLVRQ